MCDQGCRWRDVLYVRPLYECAWMRAHPCAHGVAVFAIDASLVLLVFLLFYSLALLVGWGVFFQFARPASGFDFALLFLGSPVMGALVLFMAGMLLVLCLICLCVCGTALAESKYVVPQPERDNMSSSKEEEDSTL